MWLRKNPPLTFFALRGINVKWNSLYESAGVDLKISIADTMRVWILQSKAALFFFLKKVLLTLYCPWSPFTVYLFASTCHQTKKVHLHQSYCSIYICSHWKLLPECSVGQTLALPNRISDTATKFSCELKCSLSLNARLQSSLNRWESA